MQNSATHGVKREFLQNLVSNFPDIQRNITH